jgi:hypothetical protein
MFEVIAKFFGEIASTLPSKIKGGMGGLPRMSF